MATKVFDVFIEGDKVATGTIEELMDVFKVSKTAVSLWIKNGKSKDRAIPKYKHALLNQEKTDALLQENKKTMKQLPASVYDFYEKEKFIMTGTAREISQFLNISTNNVYSYIQVGKHAFDYRKTRKHAVLNEAETRKRFPLLSISSEEELMETQEKDRRKHETKEERRLRRNIRAQMAIENSRKEELGL